MKRWLSRSTQGSERRASVGPASTPKPPPSAPSGPRAMAVPDGPRSGKPEQMREWGKAQPPRDLPPHAAQNGGASSASGAQDLRSRISDNAALSPRGHPRSPPRVGREPPPSDRRLDVPSGHDRDDSRKRTASGAPTAAHMPCTMLTFTHFRARQRCSRPNGTW